jgi:hypothetical protein
MPEKLAIIAIDAGSDVRGLSLLGHPRIGTSSGKGTLAQSLRDSNFLAYDSGRAYRTITLAAETEGFKANDEGFGYALKKWIAAGRFGHCATGLSLDGIEVDEKFLHGVDISKMVATFSPREDVRRLTKDMKIDWLGTYARDNANGLVGLDGRAMKELVEDEILEKVEGSSLVCSFSMIVDPVEAARRRMHQRGVIDYADPNWASHPDLGRTVAELKERAERDEGRLTDPVGIPTRYRGYSYVNSDFVQSGEESSDTTLIDTTGAPKEKVNSLCKKLIVRSLHNSKEDDFGDLIERLVS